MEEEARTSGYERLAFDSDAGFGGGGGRDEGRVLNWEDGLPSGEDLSPLSLLLVPPELAFAFSIPPAELKTMLDVNRATQQTILNLRHKHLPPSLNGVLKHFSTGVADEEDRPMFVEAENPADCPPLETSLMEGRLLERSADEAVDSSAILENTMDGQRTLKRPRLVWTPQLHKRFVEVVTHVGIKNVVPKTIMQLMNVEGLSRENVASHLQKYRLYLKRMQGYSNEGRSPSDHLSASTTAPPQNIREQQQANSKPVPDSFSTPMMIPMPIYSIPHHFSHEMYPFNQHQVGTPCNGFDAHYPYQPNNWSGSAIFGGIMSYQHISHNDK